MDEPRPAHFGSSWEFAEALKRLAPILSRADPIRALRLSIGLLADAIGQDPRGSTHLWRAAIEDHPQNDGPSGIQDQLITTVRDLSEAAATSGVNTVREVIALLGARDETVFRRIGLHVLRLNAPQVSDVAAEWLLDETLFRGVDFHHEYRLLLQQGFGSLDDRQRGTILSWINAGPLPGDPTQPSWANHWRLRWLTAVRSNLSGEWLDRLSALEGELGAIDHPDFLTYTTSFVGPTSPWSGAELSALPVDDAIGRLKAWTPTEEFAGPSVLGLARELEGVVAGAPDAWVKRATHLVGLEATYVHHYLSGLTTALKSGAVFDWDAPLTLCAWIMAQPPELDRPTDDFDRDSSWGPARQAIARLLEVGMAESPGEIPIGARDRVWSILEPITHDIEPDEEFEAEYGGSNMDPPTLAINTVRGVALHAVVVYALWVHRRTDEAKSIGFDAIPEAREALEHHLDPARDPSLAIRSVYGQYFPWLVLLDSTWATNSLDRVFPEEADSSSLWDAAWWTYVTFCMPYDNVLPILRRKYDAALDRIQSAPGEVAFATPAGRLVEHIVAYYARGRINLEDPLLAKLFAATPINARSQVVVFAGRILRASPPPSVDAVERLKTLWVLRRQAIVESHGDPEELVHFGWWVTSPMLEAEWVLAELEHVLGAARWVEPDHQVVEYLSTVDGEIGHVFRLLALMMESPREPWSIQSWRQPAEAILSKALRSDDANLRRRARDLVNRAVAGGNRNFAALLIVE
ncbi:MAG: hypothetical protein V2A76_05815 [Planctomycetota bacterium]